MSKIGQSHPELSLVIPLWNEGRNIEQLVQMLSKAQVFNQGVSEVVLVNNGSTDNTAELLNKLAVSNSWITPVHLETNANYGGGVYEGCLWAKNEIVGYIPGDLQISAEDLLKVWQEFKRQTKARGSWRKLFVKGNRTVRLDPFQTRFVSGVYTILGNLFLSLQIKDVNGLPKVFDRQLLDLVPEQRMRTFVFDAQLLSLARVNKWDILEIPVTFHARREGVSSWSRKRLRTYLESFRNMLRLRKLRHEKGVLAERKSRVKAANS